MWWCLCLCECIYIGRTKGHLKDIVAEHAIRINNIDYPMVRHDGNDSILRVVGIEQIGQRWQQAKSRETYRIFTFDAMVYPGLNEEIDLNLFL